MFSRARKRLTTGCEGCPGAARSVLETMPVERLVRHDVSFTRGARIALKTNGSDGFLCMKRGYVKLDYKYAKLARPVRICGPGDLVGYGNWHCDYRVVPVALEAGCACFIEKASFLALQNAIPELNERILKLLCQIELQYQQRVSVLQGRSVRGRVAGVLASLERKFGERSTRGSRIPIRIDRQTLASLSGTVTETLSRVLTDFEDKAWITRDGRFLHVLDKDALNALSHR